MHVATRYAAQRLRALALSSWAARGCLVNRHPAMQLALRRRLRLPLPLRPKRCGPSPGCGGLVDVFGDHALACPRTGLLVRRAKIVERAWVRVAREAVGADGQVVPQQWLSNTTAPGVAPDDRRRLDLVIYGASPMGGALCCDATLVSPTANLDGEAPLLSDVLADSSATPPPTSRMG